MRWGGSAYGPLCLCALNALFRFTRRILVVRRLASSPNVRRFPQVIDSEALLLALEVHILKLSGSCCSVSRFTDQSIKWNLNTKVLDFVQLGGPECTVLRTFRWEVLIWTLYII